MSKRMSIPEMVLENLLTIGKVQNVNKSLKEFLKLQGIWHKNKRSSSPTFVKFIHYRTRGGNWCVKMLGGYGPAKNRIKLIDCSVIRNYYPTETKALIRVCKLFKLYAL